MNAINANIADSIIIFSNKRNFLFWLDTTSIAESFLERFKNKISESNDLSYPSAKSNYIIEIWWNENHIKSQIIMSYFNTDESSYPQENQENRDNRENRFFIKTSDGADIKNSFDTAFPDMDIVDTNLVHLDYLLRQYLKNCARIYLNRNIENDETIKNKIVDNLSK